MLDKSAPPHMPWNPLFTEGLFSTEEDTGVNIEAYDKWISDTFHALGYRLPLAMQEILIDKTRNKKRRSGNIPERKHMYDQVCYSLAMMADGVVVPDPEMTMALQLAHDFREKVYDSDVEIEADIRHAYRPKEKINSSTVVTALLADIDVLSYAYYPDKIRRYQNGLAGFHNHIFTHGSASAIFTRGTDTIQNTGTLIGLPNKTAVEIADELDQKSIFLLHSVYKNKNGELETYLQHAGSRFPDFYEAFDLIRATVQDLILLNRIYQEHLPEIQARPGKKLTGIGVEELEGLKPQKGFRLLPRGISPTSITKRRIAVELDRAYQSQSNVPSSTKGWIAHRLSL